MADNSVFITGAAEGSLASAFNGIPPWASQKTAEDIEGILQKSLSIQAKTFAQILKTATAKGAGLSEKEIKDVNDELEKLHKNLKNDNEDEEKKKNRAKREKQEEEKKDLQTRLVTKGLTALVGAGTNILEIQKQYFSTSEDLFKSGINLLEGQKDGVTSMMSLNQIVTLTGLRLETFQKVVEKYNSSINAIGVNKFAKTLSLTSTKLISLGYNSEEQAELLGTLVDSESSYIDIRGKSEEQLADDAERLGRQMTRLSLMTGQTNAQLQENLKSLAKNTDSTVVAAVYGEEAAERMNVFSASFKDADVGKMFQTLAATDSPAITKVFQSLAKAGAAPLAETFTDIATRARDGAISAQEANKRATDAAMNISGTALQTLQRNAAAGVEGSQETLDFVTKLRAQGNTTSKATEKQVDAAIEAQASLSRFSTALKQTASLGQRTFPLLESQVNAASWALEKFNKGVIAATDIFGAETRSLIAVGVQIFAGLASLVLSAKGLTGNFNLLKSAGTLVWDGIKFLESGFMSVGRALFGLLNPFGKVVAAFAIGNVIGTVLYEMFSNFKWFNNMMDKIFAGLDHIAKYIPGLSGDAKERIATREKIAAQAQAQSSAKKSVISVPKEPTQSTINSPSASPVEVPKDFSTGEPMPAIPNHAATIPPPSSNDINSVMTYQTSILVQILETSQNLVSVNKDILKYSKVHS